MPSNERLVPLLRAKDQDLRRTPLSLAADLRVRRLLRDGGRRAGSSRKLVWAAPLFIALGALLVFAMGKSADQLPLAASGEPEQNQSAQALPASVPCTIKEMDGRRSFSGRCTLELGTATVRTDAETEVRRISSVQFEVVHGKASFDVAHVAPHADPVRVQVGGGVIEVVGTRFIVEQQPTEGSVHLLEGKIRFWPNEREYTEIGPGERFRWWNAPPSTLGATEHAPNVAPADGAEAMAPALPPRPSPPAPHRPRVGLEIAQPTEPRGHGETTARTLANQAVQRVMVLRTQGRYREALDVLTQVHGAKFDARTAEVLSFEEGNLLEHLEDAPAQCQHWQRHLRRFPTGHYRQMVDNILQRLACR